MPKSAWRKGSCRPWLKSLAEIWGGWPIPAAPRPRLTGLFDRPGMIVTAEGVPNTHWPQANFNNPLIILDFIIKLAPVSPISPNRKAEKLIFSYKII
jgi:hypothetical protein